MLSGLGVNTYKVIIDEGLNNKYLREYSAMFLGDMMVREAVKPLIKSLRKGSDLFKMEVACALRKIKDESTVDFLISEAEDPILTPYIAYSLGWRGNKKAVPFLRSLLQRKGAIKTNAASALVEIGESPG